MPVLKNAQHERFAQNVAKGMQLLEAYTTVGYSASKANACKCRWRQDVAERIDELLKIAADEAGVTIKQVVDELVKIGFANMGDFMQGDGNGGIFTDLSALTRAQSSVLSEVTVETRREGKDDAAVDVSKVKFKLHDKLGALDKLARFLGMFKDKDATPPDPNGATTVIILPSNGRDAPAHAED